jgi:hypothetical protein
LAPRQAHRPPANILRISATAIPLHSDRRAPTVLADSRMDLQWPRYYSAPFAHGGMTPAYCCRCAAETRTNSSKASP